MISPRRALVPLTLAGCVLAGSGIFLAGGSAGAATTPRVTAPSARALEARAFADARGEKWAHTVNVATEDGAPLLCTMTSSLSSGLQTCSIGAARFTVAVAPNAGAYMEANAAALSKIFRYSAVQVRTYAGHWLGIGSRVPGYAAIAYGVTLSSILSELQISGPVHFGATKMLDGVKVIGIVGAANRLSGATGDATLWVRDDVATLPVEWQGTMNAKPASFTLEAWTKAVHIVYPVNLFILSQG